MISDEKIENSDRHESTLVLDYGTGNLSSIRRALRKIGAGCRISSAAEDVRSAGRLILPGVGHFGRAMSNLNNLGLVDVLNETVLERRVPVLGICLGMELMARYGEEGDTSGLGWIDTEAVHFRIKDTKRYKIPHMGWNTVDRVSDSRLMTGVEESAEFYFGHSFHLSGVQEAVILGETRYEYRFPSVIERGNIFGVQFHPEKSRDAGGRILANFLKL